jgi:hypothetical protein
MYVRISLGIMRVVTSTASIESWATRWMTHCRNDLVILQHYHSTDELLVHRGSYRLTSVRLGRLLATQKMDR